MSIVHNAHDKYDQMNADDKSDHVHVWNTHRASHARMNHKVVAEVAAAAVAEVAVEAVVAEVVVASVEVYKEQ
jgi:hypothetical protein